MTTSDAAANAPVVANPLDGHWKPDFISGFLVFLIALPLCLGISLASGFPALAGVFTAIIGGVAGVIFRGSQLTIKGPAAGMIAIVVGCVTDFGGNGFADGIGAGDIEAYRAALAVGVAAAVVQIGFAVFRTGILGEFFPLSAVHGLLAAIGVIIISKQLPIALGIPVSGGPIQILQQLPFKLGEINPEIALIGLSSMAILFTLPKIKNRYVKMIPGQMIVVVLAIGFGFLFDLETEHTYSLGSGHWTVGPKSLVAIKTQMFAMFQDITFPDFSALQELKAWKWVLMFSLIGSLESILSTKAVDLLDPWKRKANLDRDLLATGCGNLLASFVGGLPMISEIVRSKANTDNGARTYWANFFHGMCLLTFVALLPFLIHRIPLAALAGMLVYTGFRLASPHEFMAMYKVGIEQLMIFVVTIVVTLFTDLLIGIGAGIVVQVAINRFYGVPLSSAFFSQLEVTDLDENTCRIEVQQPVVFSNWIPFRRNLERMGLDRNKSVELDLSRASLIDPSVMQKLERVEEDFASEGLTLTILGLDRHVSSSAHPHATRKKGLGQLKRITFITDAVIEQNLASRLANLGVSGYTAIPCSGMGRRQLDQINNAQPLQPIPQLRVEIIAQAKVMNDILAFIQHDVMPQYPTTVCVETVQVLGASLV